MAMPSDALMQHLRRLVSASSLAADGDAALLERFVHHKDEDAFATLVARHAPMVYGVCRRVLHDSHAAEDALQATFVVLARKAAAICRPAALASWLHRTAHHLALACRREEARRRQREERRSQATLGRAPIDPLDELSVRELLVLIDEELQQMPEVYRLPVILCALEGCTVEQAAGQLGWSAGSVRGRLLRGRARLQQRLLRRGLTLSAALLVVQTVQGTAQECSLPVSCVALAQAPVRFAAERMEGLAPRMLALAEAEVGRLVLTRLKIALTLILMLGLATGAGVLAQHRAKRQQQGQAAAQASSSEEADAPKAEQPTRRDRYCDPLPPDALTRLGTLRLRHPASLHAVAFSPDGKTVASAGWDKVRLWDPRSGKELRSFAELPGPFLSLGFSPDGKLLASGGNGVIHLWEVATGRLLHSFAGHAGSSVRCLAFAPDGKTLASGGGGNQTKTLTLWDVSTGRELRSLAENVYTVHAVAFSPDGTVLASGSGSIGNFGLPPGAKNRNPEQGRSALRLWSVKTGKELKYLRGHKGAITGLAFTVDGAQVISASSDGTIRCWDAAGGKMLRTLSVEVEPYPESLADDDSQGDYNAGLRALALAPEGRLVAVAGVDGTVRTWDLDSGKALRVLRGHERLATGVAFSSDGKSLVSCGWDQVLRLWDPAQGKPLHTFAGHEGWVGRMAVSRRGDWVVSTGMDRTLRIWDLATGQERHVLRGHSTLIEALAVSPDGSRLASGDIAGSVYLWDASSGRQIRPFVSRVAGRRGEARSAAFSPDGKLLAVATAIARNENQGSLHLWEVDSGRLRAQIDGKGSFYCVRFSPDGRWLAAYAFGNGVDVWETATLKKQRSFVDFIDFAFLPDSKVLAGWRKDGMVLVRDLASGQEVSRFQGPQRPNYVSHPIAFTPDGRLLALPVGSGSARKVQMWEMATGKVRRTLEGHRGEVLDYALAANGRTLITASRDTTLLVWDLARRSEQQAGTPTAEQMQALWQDLAHEDARRADWAIWRLAALPGQTVPFLQRRLRPVKGPDPARLARLVADLESNEFGTREAATRELAALAELAEPALQQARSENPSLEARRRIERLLLHQKMPGTSAEQARMLRAVEVLEHMGTTEARQLLEELGRGAAGAHLTRAAQTSRERLSRP